MTQIFKPAGPSRARLALLVLEYYLGKGPYLSYTESPLKTKLRALVNHDRILTGRPLSTYQ